jgi:cytochrome b561
VGSAGPRNGSGLCPGGSPRAATAPVRLRTLFLGIVPVPHPVGTDPVWLAVLRRWLAVLRRVRLALAGLLVVLACGHALMVVRHHRSGDRTLARMWRG